MTNPTGSFTFYSAHPLLPLPPSLSLLLVLLSSAADVSSPCPRIPVRTLFCFLISLVPVDRSRCSFFYPLATFLSLSPSLFPFLSFPLSLFAFPLVPSFCSLSASARGPRQKTFRAFLLHEARRTDGLHCAIRTGFSSQAGSDRIDPKTSPGVSATDKGGVATRSNREEEESICGRAVDDSQLRPFVPRRSTRRGHSHVWIEE
ncbi:hypothetical protein J3F83DRAFT_564458 [Trichoderma novae-zelandiae]